MKIHLRVNVENIIGHENVTVKNITSAFESKNVAIVDILRLDEIHPVISGNKWFKLKYYLQQADNKKAIITFGGAYSNHLVATAFAAQQLNISSVGIVRGEQPAHYSPTLIDAISYGMQLIFVAREDYKDKQKIIQKLQLNSNDNLIIDEGGAGPIGVRGSSDILSLAPNHASYTHIACAVGTGTMMAGIVSAASPHQHIIGISALKGNDLLTASISSLLPAWHASFEINFDYHFGGYAKKTPVLLQFMNDFYVHTGIPTDFVYSGKLMYAVDRLIKDDFFPQNSKLLVIHCGGLQGNRSLPPGSLIF